MEIHDTPNALTVVATAGQTVFPFAFRIFDPADVVVTVNGTPVTLTSPATTAAQYGVTVNASTEGGVVTFGAGLAVGAIVAMTRSLPITRTSDFPVNGPLSTRALNNQLERLVIHAQDARTRAASKVREDVVNIADFSGIYGTNQTLARALFQAAVNAAAGKGQALYIPRSTTNIIRIDGGVVVPPGGIDVCGGGTVYVTADTPLFYSIGMMFHRTMRDLEVAWELGAGVMPVSACIIEFAATGSTEYAQRNTFQNLQAIGARSTFICTAATRVTSYGLESSVNWNTFDNCGNIDRNGGEAKHVYWSKAGSGTGNKFINSNGQLGADVSAFHRFDGTGCVVGDIIVQNCHSSAGYGGLVDCAVVEVGTGTVYRSNIAVIGCQSDSRVTRVFRLAGDNIAVNPYVNIRHDGSLIGGGTVLGIDVPILSMKLEDRDGGQWGPWGFAFTATGTGLKTIPVFKLKFAPVYDGVRCRLNLNGLIGGVTGGNTEIDFSLDLPDAATVVPTIHSTVPAGRFGVSFTVSGLEVTVNVTLTPTGSPSKGRGTCVVRGNNFFVTRIL